MNNPKIITIEDLINKVKTYNNNEEDINLLKFAYNFAYQKHFGQKRISGEDYMQHPLHVAYILTGINADIACLQAALLHDTIEDSDGNYLELEANFGKEVASLVSGVTKINKIHFHINSEQEATTQRKLLVSLAEDVRVIIIKLADRLHNMYTLYVLSETKQKKKAKETLELLVPLAHRLGINKIKTELENLSLKYLKPNVYHDIEEKLKCMSEEKDDNVGEMMTEVSNLLSTHNIKHEIKGRTKSIYSIYNKLHRGKKWSEIYDIFAMRLLVDTEQECYLALGLIHSKYRPVPRRFKDYIAMPKPNLYQSLHTTVIGKDGKPYEIQIRTYEMNKIAEYGIASHWSYKEHSDGGKALKDRMEQKLQIFRNIIELNETSNSSLEFITNIQKDIFTGDSIFVYTPKGDIIELPKGSTPIDFAYKVHSEVGDSTIGAMVNDSIVPLNYHLHNGDTIKINTNASSHPKYHWLNFVATYNAKEHIKAYYKKIQKEFNLKRGMDALTKSLKRYSMTITDVTNNERFTNFLKEYSLNDIDELYLYIGSSKINPLTLIKYLTKEELIASDKIVPVKETRNNDNNDILVDNEDNIEVKLSNCCKPVYGDDIVGFVTTGSGISIHRKNCHNVSLDNPRIVPVQWNYKTGKKYKTDIVITASDTDILLDIITKASLSKTSITDISSQNKDNKYIYFMTIMVSDTHDIDKFFKDIQSIKDVSNIERRNLM